VAKADVSDRKAVAKAASGKDAIFHFAAQVAVTTSVSDPSLDFGTNALGSFNVAEAARTSRIPVVYTSTNKVYGNNVNAIPIVEKGRRYDFGGNYAGRGIPESFSIDAQEHTPYGVSKLVGDLYMRDYAAIYGVPAVVNRMSCIYGTKQYGNEDQGWIAHFAISAALGKPVVIYGDGRQVRDVLFVSDLVRLFEKELEGAEKLAGNVFNVGGGPENTLSLLELLEILESRHGKMKTGFQGWRPADQKVYYSDISKAGRLLGWKPLVKPAEGVRMLCDWVDANRDNLV
jgi:CDP-paratose 2-epimerase